MGAIVGAEPARRHRGQQEPRSGAAAGGAEHLRRRRGDGGLCWSRSSPASTLCWPPRRNNSPASRASARSAPRASTTSCTVPARQIVAGSSRCRREVDGGRETKGHERPASTGKTVVVTGTLQNYSRKEIEDLIALHGGKADGQRVEEDGFRRRRRGGRQQARQGAAAGRADSDRRRVREADRREVKSSVSHDGQRSAGRAPLPVAPWLPPVSDPSRKPRCGTVRRPKFLSQVAGPPICRGFVGSGELLG